jgi:hypothetical protein
MSEMGKVHWRDMIPDANAYLPIRYCRNDSYNRGPVPNAHRDPWGSRQALPEKRKTTTKPEEEEEGVPWRMRSQRGFTTAYQNGRRNAMLFQTSAL